MGEDLEGGDAAEVAPVGAIGGGNEGVELVAEVLVEEERGPVGEGDVIDGEAFLGGGGGGDEENGARAKSEEEERAMAGRDGGEGLVEGLAEEVEVADDGKGEGTGRRTSRKGVLGSEDVFGGKEKGQEEHCTVVEDGRIHFV